MSNSVIYDDKATKRIHPIQMDKIQRIIIELDKSHIVKRAIVFGSSVTDECKPGSDLDLCIDINCSSRDMRLYDLTNRIQKICEYNCDLLIYDNILDDSPIKREIDSKGVDIYVS